MRCSLEKQVTRCTTVTQQSFGRCFLFSCCWGPAWVFHCTHHGNPGVSEGGHGTSWHNKFDHLRFEQIFCFAEMWILVYLLVSWIYVLRWNNYSSGKDPEFPAKHPRAFVLRTSRCNFVRNICSLEIASRAFALVELAASMEVREPVCLGKG